LMLEGRKLGSLSDPMILSYIERQKKQKLGTMVIMDHVRTNLTVSEAEIDQMMKNDPKLDRERASMLAQQTKGRALLEQFYKQLFAKFHFKQVRESFAKVSEVHERLMNSPAKPRREGWILNSQVRDELTKEEKGIVLATYDGGEVTLRDWFEALCEIVPPRRPSDLNTMEGVERLLDRPLRSAMVVAEAKSRGYDKNPEYVREIRDLEDQQILYSVQNNRIKDIPEPNEGQIKAFYEKNKEWFAEGPFLKVDQIWCKDLATAQEVKAKLDGGADFRSVKDAHSLQKNVEPYKIYRGGEGPFWEDLWKGEPNQVVGPVKGFYEQGVAWRVVKILEKTPAKVKPYSEELGNTVKWVILGEQRKALIDLYGKELREKYKCELYADRIQGIDPLDPALYEQMKK
jgi:DNA-binding transcriptional regulator YdaS (Cro superfamily)